MGAPARRLALAAGAATPAGSAPGAFRGFTIRETAGAAATVKVHDGTNATGELLAAVTLAANGSTFELDGAGVVYRTGLFVEITGTVEGSIFVG